MPSLHIKRHSGWTDKLRRYKIILNGQELCAIKEREQLSFPIPEGLHQIEARIDWCGSDPIEFAVSESDVSFEVKSSTSGWEIFLSVFRLFTPNDWISLWQTFDGEEAEDSD